MKEFSKLALTIFKEALSPYEFKKKSKHTESNYCKLVFVNEERYVVITANTDPRDSPAYFNIILGEGSLSFPDTDWNTVALWHLKNYIKNNGKASEYDLDDSKNISELLNYSKEELLKYGADFLANNLGSFRKVRSQMNRDREPYKTTWRDKSGKYVTEYDPEGVKLKEKYS